MYSAITALTVGLSRIGGSCLVKGDTMLSQFRSHRGNRKSKRSATWGKRTAVLLLVLLTASWSVAQKISKDLQAVPSGTTSNVVVQYYNPPTTTDLNAAKSAGASNGKALGLVKGYR